MTNHIDVFNGDADGICALIQLRLAEPLDTELITGVKRDVTLLKQVKATQGDQITVLDISLDRNRTDLQRLLDAGAQLRYFDHHFAGDIPKHDRLLAVIDESPNVCTSLLVDRYLAERFTLWAIVAAFGDNLVQVAERRCAELKLDLDDCLRLRQLGELLNYNGYGTRIEDLHFHPAALFQAMRHFSDPRQVFGNSPELAVLASGYASDREQASNLAPEFVSPTTAVYLLPDAAWARRVIGVWANDLSQAHPERAHLILCPDGEGTYSASVRTARTYPQSASAFCRRYPEGGGREAAAGINRFPETGIAELITDFVATFSR
ncbi:hypothetical protein C8R30_10532 [Nitrosomonas nitrosa]|uniref:acetyltransferase n=1 Tax=Nitrosomonas nitrosa TaxID=52442 RepID=UPI000D30BF05|nr:acetyltransferase [Nitrosomonas nitrosa]PTR02774.1 hypothetical protein C8R30_10532 [Nitrosomonas nitrosa]